jgi:hypothetical protein
VNGRDGLERIACIENKLPVFHADKQSAFLVCVYNQRQQARLNLQPDDDLQQTGMKKKNFIAGVDAIGHHAN